MLSRAEVPAQTSCFSFPELPQHVYMASSGTAAHPSQHSDIWPAHDLSHHSTTHTCAGGWKDNLKHGQGMMRYSSGNTYSGEWEGDQKQGQGCMRWGTGEVYTGQWGAGLQNGLGQHVWIQPASSGATQGSNHAFFLMHNRLKRCFLLCSEEAGAICLLRHLVLNPAARLLTVATRSNKHA